jgi:hypothetical protein
VSLRWIASTETIAVIALPEPNTAPDAKPAGATRCQTKQKAAPKGGICGNFPWKAGAGEGTRTPDPIITNDVLYQLSYTGPVARC